MKTIFNASFDEVKGIVSRKEIENNSGKIADYNTGKAVDKYEQERQNKTIDDYFDLKKTHKKNKNIVIISSTLFMIMTSIFSFFVLKNIYLGLFYLIVYLLIMFHYLIISSTDYTNYNKIYPYLIHRFGIYLLIIFLLTGVMFILIAYSFLDKLRWLFLFMLIGTVFSIIYIVYSNYKNVKTYLYKIDTTNDKDDKDYSKIIAVFLSFAGILYIFKWISGESLEDLVMYVGLPILYLGVNITYLGDRLINCIKGYYLKKYSEEFRQKFGYSVEEWYGEKSKFTKRYQKGKLLERENEDIKEKF